MMAALSDIGQLVATLATAAATTGGGVAWIWNKIEKRFDAMRIEHVAAIAEVKADAGRAIEKSEREAKLCEARENRSQVRHGIMTIVVELLQAALARVDPKAWELSRTKELMAEYKAIGLDEVVS